MNREPRALAKRSQSQEAMQDMIVSELTLAEGEPMLETTVARNTGLYHPTRCGMTEFRRLVDDLAARGLVRLGAVGKYGSVEVSLVRANG